MVVGFEYVRGQIVRPSAEVVSATNYKFTSRLVIRQRRDDSIAMFCHGCMKVARKGEVEFGRFTDGRVMIRPGDLYAAGQEVSCSLCLSCVVPVES